MSVEQGFVVDATVLTKCYLPEIYTEDCLRLLDSGLELSAPEIAISQVASTLWKRARTGEIRADLAARVIRNLCRSPIHFVPSKALAPGAMELAVASGRTFNEALYFVLAIREQTSLVTADHRWHLLLSTGKLRGRVEFVSDVAGRLQKGPNSADPNP